MFGPITERASIKVKLKGCKRLVKKFGFGIIGCGSVAKNRFIPALKQSDTAELIAVASRNNNLAKEYSIEFNCDYAMDYESLVSRDDIDIVYIGTIPSTHEEIIFLGSKDKKDFFVVNINKQNDKL